MSINVNSVNSNTYTSHTYSAAKKNDTQNSKDVVESGATYEKGTRTEGATYSVKKMTPDERASLVQKLKAETDSRQQQFLSIVNKSLNGQAGAFAKATGNDSLWRILSGGDFTVDPLTKSQAQQDIGEDGYWGVKQTSQRLFDFAYALAGDDVEKMKKMQAAMEKGFKMAAGKWGGELPGICGQTREAANKLFEDYYKSKEVETEETM